MKSINKALIVVRLKELNNLEVFCQYKEVDLKDWSIPRHGSFTTTKDHRESLRVLGYGYYSKKVLVLSQYTYSYFILSSSTPYKYN